MSATQTKNPLDWLRTRRFVSKAQHLGGDFNERQAAQVISIRKLVEAHASAFRFHHDPHVIEVECCRCGETLRFTNQAAASTIEAELTGHECKARASA